MKKRRRDYFPYNSFIDMILNNNVGLMVLVCIAALAINPPNVQKSGVRPNADYIIEASWPTDHDCDVDLWVSDPKGQVVYHSEKDVDMMFLDRDSMGSVNSSIILDDNTVVNPKEFTETVSLRGIIAGEYTVNLHLYSAVPSNEAPPLKLGDLYRVPVHVKITKINPQITVMYEGNVELDHVWQEKTVLEFNLDRDGHWLGSKSEQRNLVKVRGDK